MKNRVRQVTGRRRNRALMVEALEERALLACLVESTNVGTPTMSGTLSWAIVEAAKIGGASQESQCGLAGTHEIWFDNDIEQIQIPNGFELPSIGGLTWIDGMKGRNGSDRLEPIRLTGAGVNSLFTLGLLYVDSASPVRIHGVEILNVNGAGIFVEEVGSSMQITNNVIHDVAFEAVSIQDVGQYTITGNYFYGNGAGLAMASTAVGTISGTVAGNFFGVNRDGIADANALHAIILGGDASAVTIENNRIWNSGGDGVLLEPQALRKNRISSNVSAPVNGLNRNWFQNNAGVPIRMQLVPPSTTNQDDGDGDTGPNDRLNHPTFVADTNFVGGEWSVRVKLDADLGSAFDTYRFEFYQYLAETKSYFFLKATNATLDASGNVDFRVGFTNMSEVVSGSNIAAIAIHNNSADAIRFGNTSEFSAPFVIRLDGDFNEDGDINGLDLAILLHHYGKASGAVVAEGDIDSDGQVGLSDLLLFRNRCDCPDGESLLGGGGGGEGSIGEGGGKEESSGGEIGGGESLLTDTPARVYFTQYDTLSGGGTLPASVPSIVLSGPGATTTLYVWAAMGDYDVMQTMAFDVAATTAGVVKATANTINNPDIIATNWEDEWVGVRWGTWLNTGTLNPNGIGAAALLVGPMAGALSTDQSGVHAAWDGNGPGSGNLDTGYDTVGHAFLLGSITLEAMAGSAGQSTNIVLSVGAFKFVIDTSGIAYPMNLGLGTTTVNNNAVGATDGTAHATISVEAGEAPGALVMQAPRRVERGAATETGTIPATARSASAPATATRTEGNAARLRASDAVLSTTSAASSTLRAVRRAATRLGAIVDGDPAAGAVAALRFATASA